MIEKRGATSGAVARRSLQADQSGAAWSSRRSPCATAQSTSAFVIRSPVMSLPPCLFVASSRADRVGTV